MSITRKSDNTVSANFLALARIIKEIFIALLAAIISLASVYYNQKSNDTQFEIHEKAQRLEEIARLRAENERLQKVQKLP